MNKMQEHSQKVWIQIKDIVLLSWTTGNPIATYDEIADALTQNGIMNYYGRPYNHWSLHKMIQRMNEVDEDLDFRQQHYPMYLYLKDNNIGLRIPTRPARPLKSRTVKTVDANDELDPNLIKRHISAVPRYMRNEIIFGASVQSVQ